MTIALITGGSRGLGKNMAQQLAARGVTSESGFRVAGYDPPWTIPALRRNEVLAVID